MSINKVLIPERELAFDDLKIEEVFKAKGDRWLRPKEPDSRRALGLHFLFGDDNIRRRAGFGWMSSTVAYYNSYYWLLVFATMHEERYGVDVGLEQQCIQMLELMPSDVDWAVVGEIREAAKSHF